MNINVRYAGGKRFESDIRGHKVAFVSDRGLGAQVYWIPSLAGVAKPVANSKISGVERITDAFCVLGAMPWSPDTLEVDGVWIIVV